MARFRCVGARAALFCVVVVGSMVLPAAAGVPGIPEAVAPAAGVGEALVEARCPTFSWAGVEGASGYELVVLALAAGEVEEAAEPRVVIRVQLSAGARAWVPSLESCLEHGGRYAWSVRALTADEEGQWSAPALFQVAAGPSLQEVEAAMETLRRHLGERQLDDGPDDPSAGTLEQELPLADQRLRERLKADQEQRAAGDAASTARARAKAVANLTAVPLGGNDTPAQLVFAAAPVLGSPSLSVSANVALGAASNLFKDDAVFLWDDITGNTAVGRSALASAIGTASGNTALGRGALQNTTEGADVSGEEGSLNTAVGLSALFSNTTGLRNTAIGGVALPLNLTGSYNTASGFAALLFNTTGSSNTAIGHRALLDNDTGSSNTAMGTGALENNTAGHRNVALGYRAGFSVYGTDRDDNIFILNQGQSADHQKIRIGTQGTQNGTFIAGIHGTTVTGTGVLVSSTGQLGVASSSASFKESVEELGQVSERLAALRPIAFRYREEILADGGPQVGLLAEEVAEIFPELVSRDAEGRPFGVRYDLLSVLAVAELQQQVAIVRALDVEVVEQRRELTELATLRERVAALEAGAPHPAQKRTSWRRRTGERPLP